MCAPALVGSWIYDDWATAQHAAQNDLQDLLAVFWRDSSAYTLTRDNPWPIGVTYRPLSMASLIAVQAVDPQAPFAHHLVSLCLHLACTLGLYVACKRLRGRPSSDLPLLIAAAFALHPVAIEAYGWINGRSDVLAGACVAGLACALPLGHTKTKRWAVLWAALAAAGAAFSKEPAVAAVAALCMATLLPARGLPDRHRLRAVAPWAVGGLVGTVCALLARALVTRGRVSGAGALLADPELIPTFAKSVRLALEHLTVPLPNAMLCLSHELTPPANALDGIVLLAAVGLLTLLIYRQRYRSAVLIAGAGVSLLPVLMVRHMVWLGFDRYLYLPLFLLCLSAAELPVLAFRPPVTKLIRWAALLLLAGCASASFQAARAYRSQDAWLASLIRSRPDDATGYIMATAWFLRGQDVPRAQQAVLRAPREGLSPALSHDLSEQLVRLGHPNEARQLAEQTYRAHPQSGFARFDALLARGSRGQFAEAFQLTRLLTSDPVFCAPARGWLAGWLQQPALPAARRAEIERELARMHCPGASKSAGK